MLSLTERYLFILFAFVCSVAAYNTFVDMFKVIGRGQGKLLLNELPQRLVTGTMALFSQGRIIRHRKLSSIFHWLVAYAFLFYFLVNAVDVIQGFTTFRTEQLGVVGGVYRLIADILSVAGLAAVAYFLLRRFLLGDRALKIRDNVKLHPKAKEGVGRDSLIVGVFIFLHLGFRFLGESFHIAEAVHAGGQTDVWQPFASILSGLWTSIEMGELGLNFWIHASWWIALGLILLFLPYFPYTKHAHLFMGPLNFMTRPDRGALGALDKIDMEDESIEQFGVNSLTDLTQTQILDAFACIMCNRCQEVCPAYVTGKELSPAALEVNKRYYIKDHLNELANGGEAQPLLDFAISESAVWACTSCGHCVDICPVGNEPMIDILDMRRDMMLMQDSFPHELQTAYRGIERAGNPWNNPDDRMGWTQGLDFKVPTVEENPNFEVLFWVGCAGAFDPNAQKVARATATVLQSAGVNFAVLGNSETCTGDPARRSGNEYLFFEMASANVETLNEFGVDQKTIVTSCPHCMTALGTEYKQFGGDYRVLHHTQMIADLVGKGKLTLQNGMLETVTFHDPCYLGRHNDEYDSPRDALAKAGATLMEMDRNKSNSFCCGAGGAQMWKEEEHGREAVSMNRFREARATGAETIAVGCPFCAQMMNDANDEVGSPLAVKDVAELVAEAVKKPVAAD
ncbi:MAG: (Fe-S)-binding protein [Ardenticatenaceae bacterium]|nr:(Fe-S)-binding protein [Ardenticatenaceae bacterium]